MSDDSPAFDGIRPRWQNLLPKRWLPIVLYVSVQAVLAITCPILFFTGNRYPDLFGILLAVLAGSVVPIVILVAMSRTPPLLRLTVILGIAFFCLAIHSLSLHPRFPVFAAVKAAGEDFLYHLREQVNQFAFITLLSHLLACLLGAHVSTKPIDTAANSSPPRTTIGEWLYFMTLVGLMLMPEPKEVVVSGLAGAVNSTLNDLFAELALFLLVTTLSVSVSVVVVGMVVLLPLSAWRVQLLMLVGLVIGVGGISIYLYRDKLDLNTVGGILMISFLGSGAFVPCWLLLRWAGYRLHLPRKWWIRGEADLGRT